MKEQVSISGGQVQQNNFYDYPVLRMSEMPQIDIQLMPTDNPAKGVGRGLAAPGRALRRQCAVQADGQSASARCRCRPGAGEGGDRGLTRTRVFLPDGTK